MSRGNPGASEFDQLWLGGWVKNIAFARRGDCTAHVAGQEHGGVETRSEMTRGGRRPVAGRSGRFGKTKCHFDRGDGSNSP